MAICKHCGADIPDQAKFCPKCGTSTKRDDVEQALAAAEPVAVVCKHCGANIPDKAKFCPKCGTSAKNYDVVQAAPAGAGPAVAEQPVVQSVPVQQPAPAQPAEPVAKKSGSGAKWFNDNFMLLFVISGLVSYAFSRLSVLYVVGASIGFGITLAVLALVGACAFLAVGVGRFVLALGESAEERAKHSLRDKICLAVSIIVFVFILLASIAVFVLGSDLSDLEDMFSAMFSGGF